ncbi:MAG: hypothetical protein F6K42_08335 [Leptolyngbya sp. SIO1D8]|nr:hypothetical protein [Leptolyngbya sp. SIO1D8]
MSYTNSSKTNLLDLQREHLELLLDQSTNTAYRPGRLSGVLKQLGQNLVHWLTTGSMPQISKQVQGDTEVWKVHDPVVNRTLYFDHEDALRSWLDKRYYCQ